MMLCVAAMAVLLCAASPAAAQSQSVTQLHKQPTRQGFYTYSGVSGKTISSTSRITKIATPLTGVVYAQLLLYTKTGKGDIIVAATEANHITVTYAGTGALLYDKVIAPPMISSKLPCGNIDPVYGITGTPIIDPATDSLYVAAMSTPDGGTTVRQLIFRMNVYTGVIASGWPVDVAHSLKAKYGAIFSANIQNQRGALGIVNGRLLVPYGGLAGDCGNYRGHVIGLSLTNPGDITFYRTSGLKGGIWTPGGVSTDGTYAYVSTGNTADAPYWQEGNAVLRLTYVPKFRNTTTDYFRPANWKQYDDQDIDLCGSHPVVFDYNGYQLIGQFGKDGNGYLLDRNNLQTPLFTKKLANSVLIGVPAVYTGTDKNTYIVFRGSSLLCPSGQSGELMAVRMKPTKPPSFDIAWCASQGGEGSPMATGVNSGGGSATVWSAGSDSSSNQMYAFNSVTGAKLWSSGVLGAVARFHAPIMSKGRVYIAAGGRLHGFTIGG